MKVFFSKLIENDKEIRLKFKFKFFLNLQKYQMKSISDLYIVFIIDLMSLL